MKNYIFNNRVASFFAIILSVFFVVSAAQAASTISTNIQTDGTLSVTGLSTLGNASTTLFSATGPAYFGTTATSIFTSAGRLGIFTASPRAALEIAGDLIVASSTNLNINNPEFGWGANNMSSVGGGFHTVINGRLNGTSGGTGNLVIAGTITADTAGSNFNNVVGVGASATGAVDDASVFGRSASVSNSARSTALGYQATVTSLNDTVAIGNSSAKVWIAGTAGIGTSTPTTQLQVTAAASNATSTLTVGKTGQNKGSCLELFDSAGTAVYAYVAAGATTFTLSATSCK